MIDTPTRTLADLKDLAQAVPTEPEILPKRIWSSRM